MSRVFDIAAVLQRIGVGLAMIDEEMLGYPPTANFVRPPLARDEALVAIAALPTPFRTPLRALYLECNGVEALNVHNGYYIRSIGDVVVPRDRYEPFSLKSASIPIRVFGGDGGGNLFALNDKGAVVHLCRGAIVDHVYEDDSDTCRTVANSIEEFVARLCEDVEAFTRGEHAWRYLDERQPEEAEPNSGF